MNQNVKSACAALLAFAMFACSGLPFWTIQVQAAENVANLPTLPMVTAQSYVNTVIDGEYIVTFKEGTSIEKMEAVVEKYGGEVIDGSYESNLVSIKLTNEQYKQMKNDTNIEIIEENQSVHLLQMGQLKQYSHKQTNVTEAIANNVKGKGIEIAILDTGVFPHDDLDIAGGVSTVDYTDTYQDDNGHGTHVAGIIGSKDNGIGTTGVASEATIYSVKVLSYIGKGDLMDIIEGMDWAIKKGVDIINVSLGTTSDSDSMKAKVDEAESKGIIVVASTGNEGTTNVMYPAKYDNVIAVGATDKNNNLASFSTYGPEVDIVAPGVGISSTFLNHHYAQANGTSQAAPYISGILALYMEMYPNKTAHELTQMLYNHALDLGVPGKDDRYGHGLVQFSLTDQENRREEQQDEEMEEDSGQVPVEEEKLEEEQEEREPVEEEPTEEMPVEQPETERFTDVRVDHWAFDAINELTQREIIFGYGNGKFGPNDSITRLQAVMMILRAKGITDFSNVDNPGFVDIGPGDYGYDTIAKSVELGIISGKVDGKGQSYFDANGKLTRAEMAVIIQNAYNLEADYSTTFSDVPKNHWAYEAIQALADNGISVGHGDGTYGPNESMTRAQFSVMMAKLLPLDK